MDSVSGHCHKDPRLCKQQIIFQKYFVLATVHKMSAKSAVKNSVLNCVKLCIP